MNHSEVERAVRKYRGWRGWILISLVWGSLLTLGWHVLAPGEWRWLGAGDTKLLLWAWTLWTVLVCVGWGAEKANERERALGSG